MREVRGDAKCPCESGRRYAACCKRKALKWLVDGEGEFYKQIPIVPDAREIIDKALEDFLRVFEREPRKDTDPIFLSKYLIGEEELERQTVEAMRRGGLRPELIYAYQKTGGLLLTRENEKLATTKDIQDWGNAIDEYYRLQKNPPQPHPVEILLTLLADELDSCIICLGYVLEYGGNPEAARIHSSSEFFKADDYALICATKSMKTLRAIKVLLDQDIGADALALARHLMENYLHIVYAIAYPELLKHVVDAQIGLKLGTHEFARTGNGRVDSRRILRTSDGTEYLGHISYHKMAESSPHPEDLELFDYVYSFLSEYTHPSFTGATLVLSEEGTLDPLSNELQSEGLFYSICFAVMILDELRRLPLFSEDAKMDIAVVVARVGAKAEMLVTAMFEERGPTKPFAALRDRLMALTQCDSSSPRGSESAT
ncbi:MAG TPA: DUF5677 domain-containing protein [Rhodocyclaceae bacterium]